MFIMILYIESKHKTNSFYTGGKYPEKAYKRSSFDTQRQRIDSFKYSSNQSYSKY